jgi:hypothetical protein
MQLHPLKLGRQAAKAPKGLRRVSFSDQQQEGREPARGAARLAQLRLKPVQAAAYVQLQAEQRELACQVSATAALARAWSHRREKRRAAHVDGPLVDLPSAGADPLAGDSDDSELGDEPSAAPEDVYALEEVPAYKASLCAVHHILTDVLLMWIEGNLYDPTFTVCGAGGAG